MCKKSFPFDYYRNITELAALKQHLQIMADSKLRFTNCIESEPNFYLDSQAIVFYQKILFVENRRRSYIVLWN